MNFRRVFLLSPSRLFLCRMVLKTLADHLALISTVDVDDIHTISMKPHGALMYAVQAVSVLVDSFPLP